MDNYSIINEVWKSVKGFEEIYEVSNQGNIRDANSKTLLKQWSGKTKYKSVTLIKDNTRYLKRVHRLVAIAFIPNPNNYPQINHKDEIRSHNFASNLEWCTQSYNNAYGHHDENVFISNIHEVVQLDKTGRLLKVWQSLAEISMNGFKNINYKFLTLKSDYYKGFIWLYKKDYLSMTKREVKRYAIQKMKNNINPIVQLNRQRQIIKIYSSPKEAEKFGYKSVPISHCIKGQASSYHRCFWIPYNNYCLYIRK